MSRAIGPDLRGVYRLDQVGGSWTIAEPFESFRFEIEEVIGGGRVGGVLPQAPGFSRAGLIQQLSSPAGEGFTPAQARYAVNKVYD